MFFFEFLWKHPKLFFLYLSYQISLRGRFVFKTNGRISSITSYKDYCCSFFTSYVANQQISCILDILKNTKLWAYSAHPRLRQNPEILFGTIFPDKLGGLEIMSIFAFICPYQLHTLKKKVKFCQLFSRPGPCDPYVVLYLYIWSWMILYGYLWPHIWSWDPKRSIGIQRDPLEPHGSIGIHLDPSGSIEIHQDQ